MVVGRQVTAGPRSSSSVSRVVARASCQSVWSATGHSDTGRQRREGSMMRAMSCSSRPLWRERRRADSDALDGLLRLPDQMLLGGCGVVCADDLVAAIGENGADDLEA